MNLKQNTSTPLRIKAILEEIDKTERRDIVVTLPQSVKWEDYERELEAVKDYRQTMNFKVPTRPKGIRKGDKCYVVHDGFVRGWMEIVGVSDKEFACTTTGKKWSGCFVERSGPFHYLDNPIPMKGFQGFRYYKPNQQ